LSDAAWAKYRLGEFLDTKDAKGTPVTANPWRTAPEILGMTLPQAASILQKRGATFIICNNASPSSRDCWPRHGLTRRGLQDLKANILPA
jgi:hypothetical protein